MKKCRACGHTFSDEYNFCLDDGTPLASVAASAPTVVLPTPVRIETGKRSNVWPIAIIAVLGLAVVGLAAALLLRSTNKTSDNDTKFETVAVIPAANSPSRPEPSRTATPAQIAGISPAGSWRGNWSSPSGAGLKFDLSLNESSNQVNGQIDWTLLTTNRPEKMSKIGSHAVEYVRGTYDPFARQINMSGYSKSDPDNMLVMLDQYRLTMSADGRSLSGAARNGGKWNGRIELSK